MCLSVPSFQNPSPFTGTSLFCSVSTGVYPRNTRRRLYPFRLTSMKPSSTFRIRWELLESPRTRRTLEFQCTQVRNSRNDEFHWLFLRTPSLLPCWVSKTLPSNMKTVLFRRTSWSVSLSILRSGYSRPGKDSWEWADSRCKISHHGKRTSIRVGDSQSVL